MNLIYSTSPSTNPFYALSQVLSICTIEVILLKSSWTFITNLIWKFLAETLRETVFILIILNEWNLTNKFQELSHYTIWREIMKLQKRSL